MDRRDGQQLRERRSLQGRLSALMDEVAQQRRPIIITKRGRPVAKLVPVQQESTDLFGYMAGTAKICGDIISPIQDAGWTGDDENV